MQESQYSSTHSLTTALDKGERSTFRYDFQKAEPHSVKCATSTPAYSINISIAENIPLYALIKFSPIPPPPHPPFSGPQLLFSITSLAQKVVFMLQTCPRLLRNDHKPAQGET